MNLLGLSNNFVKNIFIHVSWILKPQKAVALAKKIASEAKSDKNIQSKIIAIGYLNEFFSKYLAFGKSNQEIISINQKVDQHIETDNKIANALIELRSLRFKVKKLSTTRKDQVIKTTKSFGVSKGNVKGTALNITNTKQIIPKNCIGIFPTAGVKYETQFLKCVGIIFKNGAITSHGAILAREFNIPALVHPKLKIADGEVVEIDGSMGKINMVDM